MQHYLHIGADIDSLSYPAPGEPETVEWPVRIIDKETYHRSTLTLGDVSITVYIHESLAQTS